MIGALSARALSDCSTAAQISVASGPRSPRIIRPTPAPPLRPRRAETAI